MQTSLMMPHNTSDFLHASCLYLHLHAASFRRVLAAMALFPMLPPCKNKIRRHRRQLEGLSILRLFRLQHRKKDGGVWSE